MKITEVEPILLRGEQAYGATSGGDEATDNGDWQLIVRVATDEGLTGWADVETLAPAAVAIIAGQGMAILGFKTLSELLIGENPLDVEALWDKLYVGSAYYGRRGIAMHCISAIDNCLWSIRAEAAGMSLARLLGGRRRDKITAYASTLFRSTPEGMAEASRSYVEKGYRAVKFGWGVFGEDPGRDRELVAAAREALGPDRASAGRSRLVSRGLDGAGADAQPARGAGALPVARRLRGRLGGGLHPSGELRGIRLCAPSAAPCRWRPANRWRRSGISSASSAKAASMSSSRISRAAAASPSPGRWRGWRSRAGIDLVPHSWLTHLLTGYSLQLIATLPRARYLEFNVSQSQSDPRHRPGALRTWPTTAPSPSPTRPASAFRSIATSSPGIG